MAVNLTLHGKAPVTNGDNKKTTKARILFSA
ncbi:hypothetical protein PS2015_676 [Pseudohongiella spirulinae]|jgi:hypothetical protein|uniref:Uncharacterized protein n=1 Tax=Pseudohongiella spirulinae TaxID=1249552 RepID=A0A0S2KAF9_9GAMM|nr:hypothetical protein PS2015_676 [Pseudohongiella spirulinae]